MKKLDDWMYIASVLATLFFCYQAFFAYELFSLAFWGSIAAIAFYTLCSWAWFYGSSFYDTAEEENDTNR